jgi:hypothetical protein
LTGKGFILKYGQFLPFLSLYRFKEHIQDERRRLTIATILRVSSTVAQKASANFRHLPEQAEACLVIMKGHRLTPAVILGRVK